MTHISRRRFLSAAAQTAAGALICSPILCWGRTSSVRFPLTFFHLHTEECLKIEHTPGRCPRSVQKKMKRFLRDFRTGDTHPIDPALLDMLCRIQHASGSRGTIQVISGYRSPKTNSALRKASSGVAKKSLHMRGRAIDLRITDLPTAKLRDAAAALRTGGVGYYADSNFVHIDTGAFRTW
jgi:uncharacterized protein YcbK (DUF882 family)